MSMYICEYCGNTVEELSGYYDRDYIDNGVGNVCVREEFIQDDCACGGEFVEAKHCKLCDNYIPENGADLCDDCLVAYATPETAFVYGSNDKQTIELNGYLVEEFGEQQIENILRKVLKTCCPQKNVEYCMKEKDDFADWLVKGDAYARQH